MSTKTKDNDRFGFDARGLPRCEQRTGTGEYRPRLTDTVQTRALRADELSIADSQPTRVLNHPYGNNTPHSKSMKSRSRLDYMRALSEAIKAKRRLKPDVEEP